MTWRGSTSAASAEVGGATVDVLKSEDISEAR